MAENLDFDWSRIISAEENIVAYDRDYVTAIINAYFADLASQMLIPDHHIIHAPATITMTVPTPDCNARSLELLRSWLSPAQLERWDRPCFDEGYRHFLVHGSDGGFYLIKEYPTYNVYRLTPDRQQYTSSMCFMPKSSTIYELPLGDQLLAQKIALETDEWAAIEIANHRVHGQPMVLADCYWGL